ncbi:hypothetical protein D9V34_07080 [Mycetocola lacteus]|uniref:Uncharacterized protein n=1 Tax=Mycetocola lacteus TaxID=76637 RepID=A0A3L7AR76_9MICO|nr:hypothetical protein [Mycetocola lacteus]RLP82999.1 hypothetical protein D9V34_07080 [Mycetocola lacteus]
MTHQHASPSGEIWFRNQRVWRTVLAVGIPAVISLVAIVPEIIQAILAEAGESLPAGVRTALLGVAAAITTVAAVISRIMAIPAVDRWLRTYTPFGSSPRAENRG